MKNFFFLLFLITLGAASAFAVSGTNGLPQPSDVKYLLNNGSLGNLRNAQLGTQVVDKKVQLMKALYDYSKQGGASTSTINRLKLLDVDNKDAVLPLNSIITNVIVDALTVPVQSSDLLFARPFMSLGINIDGDLKASLAASSYTGRLAGTPVGTAATAVKTLGKSALYVSLIGGSVVAGKFNVFVEYYLSD